MKKLLLVLAAVLACAVAIAQGEGLIPDTKGFIYAAGGPAIPVGDFGADDIENEEAGLAKTGFTVNLHGAYYFTPNLGVKATGFYSRFAVENFSGITGDLDMGHWQYYGLTIGPLLHVPLTYSIDLTLSAEVGMSNAGSPEVTFEGTELVKDDWAATLPLRGGAAFHYVLGQKSKIILGADYLYMKPKFSISAWSEDEGWTYRDTNQKMGVLNVFAGIGISF